MSRKRKKAPEVQLPQFGDVDCSPLLQAFGVTLPEDLLELALTHRSYANELGFLPNNERLEFLGDAVLGLSVAGRLFDVYPSRPESDISKMRASIVSRYALAEVAQEIGLGQYVLLGKGELLTGGREKASILADTMEAMIGAIYRAHGFEVARDAVLHLFESRIQHASAEDRHLDWKTSLQERLAELKFPVARYIAESIGPDHERVFTSRVMVGEHELGSGTGRSKKAAEQLAAQQAVDALGHVELQQEVARSLIQE
ncbi:ribonuclease III [Corynebacterium gerontici]|uniref:Ribonuclease 3 n=1 Tax=Corynebacterium gerontici TaxID=2079234 RepID=A0A3G6J181_9CORY|nr:ribonuclease III [Corynebacterium gerontici]AZA11709.1 Ribonuclease 3 [Corynebacterium gerontici]